MSMWHEYVRERKKLILPFKSPNLMLEIVNAVFSSQITNTGFVSCEYYKLLVQQKALYMREMYNHSCTTFRLSVYCTQNLECYFITNLNTCITNSNFLRIDKFIKFDECANMKGQSRINVDDWFKMKYSSKCLEIPFEIVAIRIKTTHSQFAVVPLSLFTIYKIPEIKPILLKA